MDVGNTDIALSFDTAEYYNLQEACDYLNRKFKTDNITSKKLLKHIHSREINTFIHFRMDNMSEKIMRFQVESYESNVFTKDVYQLHKGELEPLLEKIKKVESCASNRLSDELYMGYILFKLDEQTLFNMTLNSNLNSTSRLLLLEGFIHKFNINDDPARPTELKEWGIDIDGKTYHFIEIGIISMIIDSTEDKYLAEFAKKVPFLCSFDKRGDFSFCEFNIKLSDIIILHKDLLALEKAILTDKPIENKGKFEARKGVSHKKILAKEFAKHIAEEQWLQDTKNEIKIGEMCEIVWAKLVDSSFGKELPNYANSLKPWIKEVSPPYASEAGRPQS